MHPDHLEKLQEALGYRFQDLALLVRALTHRTWANEHPGAVDQEAVEHLGDAALGLAVSAVLFQRRTGLQPKALARIGDKVKEGGAVARLGDRLGLDGLVRVGGSIDLQGVDRSTVLEDTTEAVLGAVFLDGGYPPVERIVDRYLGEWLEEADATAVVDPKTRLLQALQARIRTDRAPDPFHTEQLADGSWRAHVVLDGDVVSTATGRNKKLAEREAARLALETFAPHG